MEKNFFRQYATDDEKACRTGKVTELFKMCDRHNTHVNTLLNHTGIFLFQVYFEYLIIYTREGIYNTVLLGLYNTVFLTAITPLTVSGKTADLTAITPLGPKSDRCYRHPPVLKICLILKKLDFQEFMIY